jgi:hypothetical protein
MAGIQLLRDERDQDPDRHLAKRLLRRAAVATGNG